MINLQEIIPIFPLEGVVIFPNTYLPLNIFEPRYLKMIEYAISEKKSTYWNGSTKATSR